jgi:hypothetical protein
LRGLFHNEPIPNIDVRKSGVVLLKIEELAEKTPNIMFGIRFPRGEVALAKPSRIHIVSGGQVEGGGKESGRRL